MSWDRTIGMLFFLALFGAPPVLRAQTATEALGLSTYDSLTDSTHLAVVTHKGKYFLWIQHPRLTWTVAYAGRTPIEPPGKVLLDFRTQNPQSPKDNHLVIESSSGERLELNSLGAESRAGPMVGNLFMNFLIPTPELARVLDGHSMQLSVGGIKVKFKRDQVEALRDLLSRAGGQL